MEEKFTRAELMTVIGYLPKEEYEALKCYTIEELENIFVNKVEGYDVDYLFDKLMNESKRCEVTAITLIKVKKYLEEVRIALRQLEQEKLKKAEGDLTRKVEKPQEPSLINWFASGMHDSYDFCRRKSHPMGMF